jgi:hypothetical protein
MWECTYYPTGCERDALRQTLPQSCVRRRRQGATLRCDCLRALVPFIHGETLVSVLAKCPVLGCPHPPMLGSRLCEVHQPMIPVKRLVGRLVQWVRSVSHR